MSDANKTQVGGTHYQTPFQHWDLAAELELDYFQGQITKYISRWRKKNGIKDLQKCLHFIEKKIEVQDLENKLVAAATERFIFLNDITNMHEVDVIKMVTRKEYRKAAMALDRYIQALNASDDLDAEEASSGYVNQD